MLAYTYNKFALELAGPKTLLDFYYLLYICELGNPLERKREEGGGRGIHINRDRQRGGGETCKPIETEGGERRGRDTHPNIDRGKERGGVKRHTYQH